MFSQKTTPFLKKQHFLRLCLKTPTLQVARRFMPEWANRVGRTKNPLRVSLEGFSSGKSAAGRSGWEFSYALRMSSGRRLGGIAGIVSPPTAAAAASMAAS